MADSKSLAHWEGWRVSSLLEDAPTNLGVMRNANLVQDYGQNSSPLSFSESYTTNLGNSRASNEKLAGQSGQIAAFDFGGKLDDVPARNDDKNRSNSGPAFFSVAGRSGGQISNVNEVKHGSRNAKSGQGFEARNSAGSLAGTNRMGNESSIEDVSVHANQAMPEHSEITQSARVNSPASIAAFDAQAHVTATCADSPEESENKTTYTPSESSQWAMANYAIDPVQNSKNRWRIRIRCRKTGCKHSDHLRLKTITFMSDSAYKKLTRSKAKYELWKKSIIAENAISCRKDGEKHSASDE